MAGSGSSSNAGCGVEIGNVLAAILSWCSWHSIGWALLHLVFGWFYVIWWLIEWRGVVTLRWK